MKKTMIVFLVMLLFSGAASAVCVWIERYCVSPGQASCYLGQGSCRGYACVLGTDEKMTLYAKENHEMIIKTTAMRDHTMSDYDQCIELTGSNHM